MFEQILIAVDASDPTRQVTRAGVELATAYDASVDAVVVAGDGVVEEDARDVAADVRGIGADSQADVTTHVVENDPQTAIVDTANELDADVIVVEHSDPSGIGERLLGDVTERVLRSCNQPVLAVPPDEGSFGEQADVLLTTDGTDVAREAVLPGTSLAATFDGTLHVLSVVDLVKEGGAFSAGGVEEEFVERLVDERNDELDAFAAACREAARTLAGDADDLDVERSVRTGRPDEEIAEYVDQNDVDLVAMASAGERSIAGQLLGSTTDSVLRTVDVPVLVVPVSEGTQ